MSSSAPPTTWRSSKTRSSCTLRYLPQTEDDVRSMLVDGLSERREVVSNAEHAHLVAHGAQRRDHVVLAPPGRHLLLAEPLDVVRRDQQLVHQHQDRGLPAHSTIRWFPAWTRWAC